MRHSAICRRDEAAPHLFRTVEHAGGEDGLIWSERKGGASTCEAHIRDLVGAHRRHYRRRVAECNDHIALRRRAK
jgi:hypothetical protein